MKNNRDINFDEHGIIVFVTFQNKFAAKFFKKLRNQFYILSQKSKKYKTLNPSDIIWEDLYYK